jgi:hypothetical protein
MMSHHEMPANVRQATNNEGDIHVDPLSAFGE